MLNSHSVYIIHICILGMYANRGVEMENINHPEHNSESMCV